MSITEIRIIIILKKKLRKAWKKKEGGSQAESKVAKTGEREKRNGEGGFCLRYGSGRHDLIIYSNSHYVCSMMYVHFRQRKRTLRNMDAL